MSICDIRIDFVSLHKSMLLEEGRPAADNRPTVRRYIDELTNGRDKDVKTRAEMNNINNVRTPPQKATAAPQRVKPPTIEQERLVEKHEAAALRLPQGVTEQGRTVNERVSEEQKIAGELIIRQAADGTYVEPITY